MADFKDLVEFRTKALAEVADDRWLWPKADKGAFQKRKTKASSHYGWC
jgi:hypothetical protein